MICEINGFYYGFIDNGYYYPAPTRGPPLNVIDNGLRKNNVLKGVFGIGLFDNNGMYIFFGKK